MNSIQSYIEEITPIPKKIKLSSGDPLGLKSGHYTVLSDLGRGGFAHVYSIRNRHGEIYAIKILDLWSVRQEEHELLKKKFDHEFNAGRIQSRTIARSYFIGYIAGNPYIIMDYCPNGSLAKRLRDFESTDRYEKLSLEILNGLNDLHREGIIHRDLKPENILFDEEDHPRLTDFGIAGHLRSRLTSKNIIGMVGQVWGTVLYSPPEQLSHKKAYKHTAPSMDIFSFGVMMYEVITGGHHPFGDHKELLENTNQYLDKVNNRKIIPLKEYRHDVPARWEEIIERCLEPKPQDRYASVDELIQILSIGQIQDQDQQLNTSYSRGHHAVLKVVEGDNVGHVYYLIPTLEAGHKKSLSIGWADPDKNGLNDIELVEQETRYISRQHATLCKDGEEWMLMDGQLNYQTNLNSESTNGTFVNYSRILFGKKIILKNSDIITVGNVILKFMLL
jgi:serine/threonine protein kinase